MSVLIIPPSVSGKPVSASNWKYLIDFVNFVFMNQNELISRVKGTVRSIDPMAKVILFGSRARGDDHQSSDWDFLILVSQEATEQYKGLIRDSLIDTELEAEQVISTVIYSKDQWPNYQVTPLFQNIAKEGFEV